MVGVAEDLFCAGEGVFAGAEFGGVEMAAAVLKLGRLPGVDRPGLAVQMITDSGPFVLIDIGANPDSTPENLYQYAHMGKIFSERVLGVPNPRVALLSIGEEKGKGDQRIQRATELLDQCRALGEVDLLINNAGLAAGRDLFEEALLEDWETMIDTNIKGLLYITRAVIPLMVRQNRGHIINIGSIAGKEVYERGNVYCATKAAVDALSQAMRADLLRHQIKVTAIHPGAAETEFSLVRFKGDPEKAAKVYEGYTPLSAEDIADITFYTASLPAHVCINDLVVTPTAQANSFYLLRK